MKFISLLFADGSAHLGHDLWREILHVVYSFGMFRRLFQNFLLCYGADYLVVGRPITGAPDPGKAASEMLSLIDEVASSAR